jgi:hypothetical protein
LPFSPNLTIGLWDCQELKKKLRKAVSGFENADIISLWVNWPESAASEWDQGKDFPAAAEWMIDCGEPRKTPHQRHILSRDSHRFVYRDVGKTLS